MKVYVLVEYLSPFDPDSPASEQVAVWGVFSSLQVAEAAWKKSRELTESAREDYEIVECTLDE